MLGCLSHSGFSSGGGSSPGSSFCALNSSDLQNGGTNILKPPCVQFGEKQEAFGREQPFPVPSPCSQGLCSVPAAETLHELPAPAVTAQMCPTQSAVVENTQELWAAQPVPFFTQMKATLL